MGRWRVGRIGLTCFLTTDSDCLQQNVVEGKSPVYLARDSGSTFVLSTTTLLPAANALLHSLTHFCHVFRVS